MAHTVVLFTYGGHGDHQEIDAVPIRQGVFSFSCISEVRGVTTVFKLKEKQKLEHTQTKRKPKMWGNNLRLTKWMIPAAVSQTDTKIDMSWASLNTSQFFKTKSNSLLIGTKLWN